MKRIVPLIGFFLLFSGFACSVQVVPAEKPSSTEALVQKHELPAKAAWEMEWDRLMKEAKKEGRLTAYGDQSSEIRAALIKALKNKFGLGIDLTVGKGAEISEKILTERRSGIFNTDIYLGGATTLVNVLKPQGVIESVGTLLFLPEVKDEKNWYGGKLPWTDKDQTIFAFMGYPAIDLARNTELVKEGEIKSWEDLLHPRWKDKILLNDPTVAGAGLGWFSRTVEKYGVDFMKKLTENRPVLLRDRRLQVEWLARGKYALCIDPGAEQLLEFKRAGAPVMEVDMAEGTLSSGVGHITLINKAPHPNTARLFANWLLSREGQTIYSEAHGQQSMREDGPTAHVIQAGLPIRKPGVKYQKDSDEEALLRRPAYAGVAREIFGPLMK